MSIYRRSLMNSLVKKSVNSNWLAFTNNSAAGTNIYITPVFVKYSSSSIGENNVDASNLLDVTEANKTALYNKIYGSKNLYIFLNGTGYWLSNTNGIEILPGETLYIYGTGNSEIYSTESGYATFLNFKMISNGTASLAISGTPARFYGYNIDGTLVSSLTSTSCCGMFANFTVASGAGLTIFNRGSDYYNIATITVDNLNIPNESNSPSTKYAYFFKNQLGLRSFNKTFNITSINANTFSFAFNGCTNLTTIPKVSATTVSNYAMRWMYMGCTSLTTVPTNALPNVSTIGAQVYYSMFLGCTSLTTVPNNLLPATTVQVAAYKNMFKNCTSLTSVIELPATTLADSCYFLMFYGCSSLSKTPNLPATTLAEYCYSLMFLNCSKLTEISYLPATTLAPNCYYYMFSNCTNLQYIPILPAISATSYCYSSMFRGCSKLLYACLNLETASATDLNYMFLDCSVLKTVHTHLRSTSYLNSNFTNISNVPVIVNTPSNTNTTIGTFKVQSDGYAPYMVIKNLSENDNEIVFSIATESYIENSSFSNYNLMSLEDDIQDDLLYYSAGTSSSGSSSSVDTYFTSSEWLKFTVYSKSKSGDIDLYGGHLIEAFSLLPYYAMIIKQNLTLSLACSNISTSRSYGLSLNIKGLYAYGCWGSLYALTNKYAAYCYYMLFYHSTTLLHAPALYPTTTNLTGYNYIFKDTFNGCVKLGVAPSLPPTTLSVGCYWGMFANTGIIEIPNLPATTIPAYAYKEIFYNCINLRPVINNTLPSITTFSGTLAVASMFSNCTSLTEINWDLTNATFTGNAISTGYACYCMCKGCTSLIRPIDFSVYDMPPTLYSEYTTNPQKYTVPPYTFAYAYDNCTSLIINSCLNRFLIYKEHACNSMYRNCISLNEDNNGVYAYHKILVTLVNTASFKNTFTDCISLDKALIYSAKDSLSLYDPNESNQLYIQSYNITNNGTAEFYECYKNTSISENVDSTFIVNRITALHANTFYGTFENTNVSASNTSFNMFNNISTVSSATAACKNMFKNCKNMKHAFIPQITTLYNNIYESMYEGCDELQYIQNKLPATTLSNYCYKAMFKNCPNLEYYDGEYSVCLILPAKTPKVSAYELMFYGCTMLARYGASSTLLYIDIQLEKTTTSTLKEMFYNCNWLCGIKIGFTPNTTYLSTSKSSNWLYNVGSNRWEGGETFICTPNGSNNLGNNRNSSTIPTSCRIIDKIL